MILRRAESREQSDVDHQRYSFAVTKMRMLKINAMKAIRFGGQVFFNATD
jgi:hypothetical protein